MKVTGFLGFGPTRNRNDPFLDEFESDNNSKHTDLNKNLPINTNYEYPLDENLKFIKIVPVKYKKDGKYFEDYPLSN